MKYEKGKGSSAGCLTLSIQTQNQRHMTSSIQKYLIFAIVSFLYITWVPKQNEEWFPFQPSSSPEKGEIGMQEWLDAPAGKHGFVTMEGANLLFEDGAPVKFWGTNINGSNTYPSKELADQFVDFLAKYGVNAIRFHKFTWNANDGIHSTRFDPDKMERLDYFHSKLKEQGLYYGWSHIYGHKVLPGDSSSLLAYEEIKNLSYPWAHLNGSTSSLVNFAPDLQDLNIALTVNMLSHVNPITGLRYADDPGLAFVEFQNEDNIFWSAIERSLDQAPTYRKLLCRMFSEWLMERYGSQVQLEKAWGADAIPEGESLEDLNIYPQPNHSLFSQAYEKAIREHRTVEQHLLDKMLFLYEKQMDYYQKFEKAVRDVGYKGLLVGSCWQAGSGISHFYNLHADYNVGMIDRHNYFGGGAGGHRLDTGNVKNLSMLQNPGSGLLSTGMQQVVDRPFSFSEWMSLVPNEWTAEATPIIAAYGMGLQGWDASFSFATDIPRFSPLLESEHHGVYNATSPLHMGLYPALARMIYRGDVTESEVITTRNVHIPSLEHGKLGFDEKVTQGFDDKEFSGTFTPNTLAIGRMPIAFTDEYIETNQPDVSAYHNLTENSIQSITGELDWHYGEKGYFTINTDATKGVVGFLPDETLELGDWKMTSSNPFAVILLGSLEKENDLLSANRILLTTVARGRNTGMQYSDSGDKLIAKGSSPLLLEPVDLTLQLPEGVDYTISVLDHDGNKTAQTIPINSQKASIAGSEHHTIYYLIEKQ